METYLILKFTSMQNQDFDKYHFSLKIDSSRKHDVPVIMDGIPNGSSLPVTAIPIR